MDHVHPGSRQVFVRKTGPRVYEVAFGDFPIKIAVEAIGLPANRAIVGAVRIEAGGVVVGTFQPALDDDQPSRTIRYEIPRPASAPVNLTQTIDGFFDAGVPQTARYRITIAPAAGDPAETFIRVPSINPGSARLTFVVRSQS